MTKRVLVTGKQGQLGLSLQKLVVNSSCLSSMARSFDFVFVGRDELDLSSSDSVEDYFANNSFDAIINCAAYTAVDKAEIESELANQINHLAVAQLAKISKKQNILFIHISTDYVFNGQAFTPYLESDSKYSQSVYGLSKLHGEQKFLESGCMGKIIRTSWLYSEFGNNFVKTMIKLGKERDSLNVIYDQVGCPTYATDLAEVILLMLSKINTDSIQNSTLKIYHYSNEGVCSWYDFSKAIFELYGIDCEVNPIETIDYPTPANRPHYSVMNKSKIKTDFSLQIPYWRDSLNACLKILEN